MSYCDESSASDGYLQQGYCGAASLFGSLFSGIASVEPSDPIAPVVTTAGQTAAVVSSNAGQAVSNVAASAAEVGKKAANPLNALSFGLGAGLGPFVALAGIGVGAFVLDQLVFEGQGTRAVSGFVRGRRR